MGSYKFPHLLSDPALGRLQLTRTEPTRIILRPVVNNRFQIVLPAPLPVRTATTMSKRERRTAAQGHMFAAGVNKHIYFSEADVEDESEHQSKRCEVKQKRKRSRVFETLIISTEPRQIPSTSNQFDALRASKCSSHEVKQRRRKFISSSSSSRRRVEFHRPWSHSSRDFSGCKGLFL